MLNKIQNRLAFLPAFMLGWLGGFYVTVMVTGSVSEAVENGIVVLALWALCALIWGALRAAANRVVRSARNSDPKRLTRAPQL